MAAGAGGYRRGDDVHLGKSGKDDGGSSALEQLDDRYAKGEIDREEYLQRKQGIIERYRPLGCCQTKLQAGADPSNLKRTGCWLV